MRHWLLAAFALAACNARPPPAAPVDEAKLAAAEARDAAALNRKLDRWLTRFSRICEMPADKQGALRAESEKTRDAVLASADRCRRGFITKDDERESERELYRSLREKLRPILSDVRGSPACGVWVAEVMSDRDARR